MSPRALVERVRERLPWRGKTGEAVSARVKVPTVLQMEAVECGAASLAMILAHHGRRVPLEEVRVACGVSRDGSKASNVLKAARGYGLDAKGYKKEPRDLRVMCPPSILHWNFAHFLVLEGFGKGVVYLNDPSHGPRTVSDAEFDESFTGVVLTFAPGPDFEKGGEGRNVVASLRRRLAGSHAGLLFIVLAGLGLVFPGLLVPTFARVFVDDVLVKGMHDWGGSLLAAMGATLLVLAALTALQQRYLLRLETKLALSTSARFFWHVLHLPMAFFTQRFPGEIASRVGINDRVAQLLSGDLATTFVSMVVVAFYAALMVQYDRVLTVIAVTTAILNVVALRMVAVRRQAMYMRLVQDRGKAMGTAMGGLVTIENLKATGSESDFFSRWAGYYAKITNAQQELGFADQLLAAVPPFLMAVSTTSLLWLGGLRVMNGEMSMGMLVAFQALMLAFLGPVNVAVSLGNTAQEVASDMERLDDVLRSKASVPSVSPPPSARTGQDGETGDEAADDDALDEMEVRPKLSGALELSRLSFGYSRLEPALIQDFSLSLKPGSRVALVGGSGSGKSTVARLVSGLYEPWAGEILLDGVPRDRVPREVLSGSLAAVDQDVFMFEGTIADNLTMWDPTVPEAEMVEAARDACIHDDVTARAGGYLGKMEEGGRNFSGGQRQRIEIARALAARPTLLVLDEATSALDPSTEKEIDDNLRRRGCTCLIVAHRLSTIRDCDEIVVMEQGKIVQRGTHDTLKEEPGLYRQLISME
ncbi:MAG TPA: NHLP family bacteriocin export ABC transporter peptidase/permease/ATPase subunit [Longimicrobium sp.]|nr:NHLP family bacteriocin export ABC transporter peptidase/permease/ATPase subunit [Longimicrobium sp.]